MSVEVLPCHVEGLLCGWQHLDPEVFVVVPLLFRVALLLGVVVAVPVVMVVVVVFLGLVGVGFEVDFAEDFLEMQVAIEVVLEADDPFLRSSDRRMK